MAKTLQRKFMFASMLAVTILLVTLVGTINIMNCCAVINRQKVMLEMLCERDGRPEGPGRLREMDAEKDCGPAMDAATRKGILLAMRPAIANIKDEAQRKAMTDAVLKIVNAKKETAQDSDAAKLAKIAAGVKAPKAKNAVDIDAVEALYDARNPHKAKKEDK